MNVAVVAPSPVPYREGGAERLTRGLTDALSAAGHASELIKLPVRELTLPDLVLGYEAFAGLDLSHFDVVVSGKYPAWAVEHPGHVVWMLHPLRGLYDTYPAAVFADSRLPDHPAVTRILDLLDLLDLPDGATTTPDQAELVDAVLAWASEAGGSHESLAVPSPMARAVVHHLDRIALAPRRVRRHLAISSTVASRPDYFPADVGVVVAHPPSTLRVAAPREYGPAFLCTSRLEPPKRIDLVIEAFRRSRGDRLVIAGEGSDRDRLVGLAAGDTRISFAGRLGDDELADLYAGCRAVLFAPVDEDLGYVTLEAMSHARPVVTCTDSGGPTELVVDGRSGLVVPPDPRSLAAAIDRLAEDPGLASGMGSTGQEVAHTVTWEAVVEAILPRPGRRSGVRRSGRPRVLALSTFPVHPRDSGGQLRTWHLLGAIGAREGVEAHVLSTSPLATTVEDHDLAAGVTETTVPLSGRHVDAETRLRLVTGNVSITDVAVGLMWRATPSLVRELRSALDTATVVVAAHPYLAPAAVELGGDTPVVYDAHNHEASLKATIYPRNEAGRWLLARVSELEGIALDHASLLTAVTGADLAALCRGRRAVPRAEVVPNGVDTEAIRFVTGPDRQRRHGELARELGLGGDPRIAVFVGSGHAPNIEAGRLVLDSAPGLPDTTFVLAGRHCEKLRGTRLPANVILLGPVGDERLAWILAGGDVALNPMLSGAGSNLKVLHYMAAGIPVVTTSVGARGIDAEAAGIVVAPHDALGEGIELALGGDSPERTSAARRWVETHGDWRSIGSRFADLVLDVAAT